MNIIGQSTRLAGSPGGVASGLSQLPDAKWRGGRHRLRLAQDYTFSSPSTASGVVLGRSSNGREDWKDEAGRSLKQLQSSG